MERLDKIKKSYEELYNEYNFFHELVKGLSRARLVASKSLEKSLREFFSLVMELEENSENRDEINTKIKNETMVIEQKMRRDIKGRKTLSNKKIDRHLYYE